MTFEEMFAQAKTMLENASAKNADTAVAVQFDVSGEGCGAFYAVVSADSDKLTIEPYDYKGHDVLVSADAAELLDALRSAETDALTVEGDWDKVAVFREVLATLPTPKKAAAPKAGGWLHHPKGGEAYADNFDLTYPWICNYDQG